MYIQTFKIDPQNVLNNHFNLGLLYYKYLPFLKEDLDKYGLSTNHNAIVWKSQKDELLNSVVKISKKLDDSRLKTRLKNLQNIPGVKTITRRTQSRLLCGVGYQSRIEWGFSFDWTTGFPYLPGSSFKGALLSYLEFLKNGKPVEKWDDSDSVQLLNHSNIKFSKKDVLQIFGPQGKNITKSRMGSVVFLDVYPQNFKGLEVDVITPHYQKYYTDQGKTPPADIYNPVPQYFLTVPKDTEFMFMFRLLDGNDTQLANKLKALIQDAGENYGFGAKTATGYGYFKA
ncbi:type III-B CRISPR module RAMP protein Cmr6 [Caldithrix abyssi]